MADAGGVWRTVGGRRIFIKDGEDLKTAMKRSGKFKNLKPEDDVKVHTINSENGTFNIDIDDNKNKIVTVTNNKETHFNMKDLGDRVKESINEIENYYKKVEEFNNRKNTPEYKKQQKEFEQYIKNLINNR